MKNKGLSVLISLFAVLILSVSFSLTVFASGTSGTLSTSIVSPTFGGANYTFGNIDFSPSLNLKPDADDNQLYKLDWSYEVHIRSSQLIHCFNNVLGLNYDSFLPLGYLYQSNQGSAAYDNDLYYSTVNYLTGSQLNNMPIRFYVDYLTPYSGNITLDCSFDYYVNSITLVSSSESADYESGYNAGFTAGEEAGYSSGYSSGFQAGVDSIDQDAIYDQGFQAGYEAAYDAGYQAGYAAAYDAGYSSGYNVGYDDAMAAIESWGADGNIYPSLIFDWTRNSEFTVSCNARSQYPGTAFGSIGLYNGFDLADPNHVYKVEFNFVDQGIDFDDYSYSGFKRVFMIGDKEFAFTGNDGSFFIDGNDFSSDFLIGVYAYYARASSTDTPSGGCQFGFDDFNVKIYDYGFKDNMQNIIANQTNDLTNGYDAGSITESNTSLSSSLTQYDQAEAEITGQSVGFIDGVEFYDPASNAQLLTCITFCSSFLQSLFVNLGDWGILPMISLSLALGLMLVGWFKYRK